MSHSRSSRPMVVIALAALLISTGWPASAARAADDSNIPGVPLPGSVVTGQLGGPIYDHVYSIEVPAGSLVLLSLTGDAGTDFDLYLFDSSATTVYRSEGQVAQSIGPTSTESITYATIGGGRFYIDLNGATDVEGHFRLVVSVERDKAPPQASLRLEGGALATVNQTVRVSLIGTDDLSGVDAMQLSVDGVTWGAFVPYVPTFLWSFPSGDGIRQLWARVRDRAGNVSNTASASILVDTVAPSVLSRTPGPNETAAGLRPTFSVTFDEPIDPATWQRQGLVVQRLDGSTVPGNYTWQESTRTGTFVPSIALIAGESVACSLAGITDLAGNPLASIGTWLVVPLKTHLVTLSAATPVVSSGARAILEGEVDGPVLAPMTLEGLTGGAWTTVASIRPDQTGRFSTTVTVSRNTWYRVHIGSSQVEASSSSSRVRVVARRGLSLLGVDATTTATAVLGKTVGVVASLTPAAPGTLVTLTVSRYDSVKRAYAVSAKLRGTSSSGRVTFHWRPTRRGSYTMRVSTASTPEFANGLSAAYRWSIT